MAVKRGLFRAEELAQLSEQDRKLIRERIISELLGDKQIKAMVMRDFEGLLSGLNPKIRNKLKQKVRPLKKRLAKKEAPVEGINNVTRLRTAGAD